MAYSARSLSTNLLQQAISQAHTFVVGNIVKFTGTYQKASADTAANAASVGMVSYVSDANTFYVTQAGYISQLSATIVDGTNPVVAGGVYYLSPTAGSGYLTLTKPSIVGQTVKQCFIADSASSGYFFNNDGHLISPSDIFNYTIITMDQTLAVNNGYLTNGAMELTLPLPATSPFGSLIKITNLQNGFKITQTLGANQQITNLSNSTTLGAGGYLEVLDAGVTVDLLCTTTDQTWQVLNCNGAFTLN